MQRVEHVFARVRPGRYQTAHVGQQTGNPVRHREVAQRAYVDEGVGQSGIECGLQHHVGHPCARQIVAQRHLGRDDGARRPHDLHRLGHQKQVGNRPRSLSSVCTSVCSRAISVTRPVMAPTVKFLCERGIPVMAHVGLTPQAVNALGGYGARGRSEAEAAKILDDAKAVAEAGCFALVVEGVVEPLAVAITQAVACPTIGIGASPTCDGQVLVVDDMLGMFERVPRFVERFDDLAARISDAAARYAGSVRERRFSGDAQLYR